ncbi:uncharacterized protein LOC131930808 [Physella acuta]|uniref:uncharacterized protein LOC131930808 n=1 Tax=Physella acuta TaxID=109671 RepID=UPI0027DCF42E|nr:uncharacterized protein LOC131930808 [Physella acuta]
MVESVKLMVADEAQLVDNHSSKRNNLKIKQLLPCLIKMYGKLLVVLGLISVVSSTDLSVCLQELAEELTEHKEQGFVSFGNSNTYQVIGNDHKQSVQAIKFAKPYGTPPTVVLSLEAIDTNKDVNMRYFLHMGVITTTSAQIILETWADSLIYSAQVRWYAFD